MLKVKRTGKIEFVNILVNFQLHQPIDDELDDDEKGLTREEVYEKRLAEAVYLYMMLCLRKRWNVILKFGKTLEETILSNIPLLKFTFEKTLYENGMCP